MKLLIWIAGAIAFSAAVCIASGASGFVGAVLGLAWGFASATALLMWWDP